MALKYDIIIDQDSPFSLTVDLVDDNGDPVVTSGWSGVATMKKHFTSTNSYSFDVNFSNGAISIAMTSAYTSNIVPGRYVYDAKVVFGEDDTERILEGIATVTPSVS
jgi:hypothetical protein